MDVKNVHGSIFKKLREEREYKLKDTSTPDKEQIKRAEEIFKRYVDEKKDKLKILLGLHFLLFIILITITIKFNIKLLDSLYYIIYFISLFNFTILLFYKKEKIGNILMLSSSYIVQQFIYFFIISRLFLILSW